MMNEETKASLNRFLKQREERIKNMTLAEARDIISSTYGHSDMRIESDKALQMLLDCVDKTLKQQPCEDCISREALIDKATSWDTHFTDSERYVSLSDIMASPSVTPQQQRWIPVSERLPEENGQYLITVEYKPEADYENIYAEHGEWVDGRWDMFCFGHCGEVEDIVAWMPLPEPYRESEAQE